ncbi:MAG: hypothetical protein JWO97_1683 [Acidobacteria bacterium]|nr:hypothetical protein [Acidobacteriota bacterium]
MRGVDVVSVVGCVVVVVVRGAALATRGTDVVAVVG